jgi:hypothetical protein
MTNLIHAALLGEAVAIRLMPDCHCRMESITSEGPPPLSAAEGDVWSC